MKKILLPAVVMFQSWCYSQTPGGVGEVSLWVKADASKTSGLVYVDDSGNRHEVSTSDADHKPTYGLMNYNETLHFDGVDDEIKIPYLMETLDKMSFFSVYQNANTTKEGALFTTEGSGEKAFYYSTSNIFRYHNDQIHFVDPRGLDQIPSLSVYSKFDMPSQHITNILGGRSSGALYVGKDMSGNNWAPFKGQLPEFFVYRKVLTQNEKDRVNSYLAMKYGISLPYTEYFSSKNIRVWKKEDYMDYPNHITALGRDSFSGLYQKQSSSSSEAQRLIIASGAFSETNKTNTSEFGDQTFLVWGGDSNPLELDTETLGYQLLKRKWKTRFYTESSLSLPLEVVFSIKDIIPEIPSDKTLWLLIDRTGKGDFNRSDLEAYAAERIDSERKAYFKNVVFDKDFSGTDVFSFALGPKLLSVHELTQPTCINTTGNLNLNIKGGNAPYQLSIKGAKGTSQEVGFSSSQVSVANLNTDVYTAELRDASQVSSKFTFQVSDFKTLKLDLGEDQVLKSGQYIELDASKHMTDPTMTYHWKGSNGFSSHEPKIRVYEPREYTVKATNAEGCTKTDGVTLTRLTSKGISIYPNPTNAGEYFTIRVDLDQPENLEVSLYDLSGRLLRTRKEVGKSSYELRESLSSQGVYLVVVRSQSEHKTFKIIIH